MQAIKTKTVPATNSRPARVRAGCAAGFCYKVWDHSVDEKDNHRQACEALLRKLGWAKDIQILGGGDYAGDTYWVLARKGGAQ